MKKILAIGISTIMAISMSTAAFAAVSTYFPKQSTNFTVGGVRVNAALESSNGNLYEDIYSMTTLDYVESTIEVNTDLIGGTDHDRGENRKQANAFVDGYEWDTEGGWYYAASTHIARMNGRDGREVLSAKHNF